MDGGWSPDRARRPGTLLPVDRAYRGRSLGRALVRDAYERIVRRHMYQELQALRNALARDLIGADDFRPRSTSAR